LQKALWISAFRDCLPKEFVEQLILEAGMETPNGNSLNLLLELEPRRRAFWSSVGAALRPVRPVRHSELGLWQDVFVRQGIPWGRIAQSVILHSGAFALIWMLSASWLREQSIAATPEFDHSSLITYTPEEYLPPLDTGVTDPAPPAKGDPEFAKQPILS